MTFTACKKEDTILPPNDNLTIYNSNCTLSFSEQNIADIGLVHNKLILDLFENYNFSASDRLFELKNQFILMHPELPPFVVDFLISNATKTYNQGFNVNVIEFSNLQLVSMNYNKLHNLIDTSSSIINLNIGLDLLKIQTISSLSCVDRYFLLTCIEVARKSAVLWTPINQGGQGLLSKIYGKFNSFPPDITRAHPCWKLVIAADITGAAGGFMAMGIGLGIPGTNVGVACLIGYEAGYGSAMAAALCR